MQSPLQITFKDIPHSEAVETHIKELGEKLEHFSQQIISCHVVIEQTQKHQNQGKLYNIHITLTVPRKQIVINHNEAENLYIAIRDAFNKTDAQLKAYNQQIKGQTKTHTLLQHGKIVRLFQADEFGFIADELGDEYYFNSGNVLNSKFEKLTVGKEVRFLPDFEGQGPQARRVAVR